MSAGEARRSAAQALPDEASGVGAVSTDNPEVVRAVREYLKGMEAGQKPNRREFLARYREVADAVAECLDALEFVHAVGPRLDDPARGKAASPAQTAALDPATPLGDFRILREIGRGGMGVVYEAEQLSLGRRIALKILPFALTLDARQLQRFKNEARAAAHLHHSNIVPVYSVGCERGIHFYAMQFIEGQTLAEVIRGLRQLAGAKPEAADATKAPIRPDRCSDDPTGPYVPRAESAAADTVTEPVGALATAHSTNSPVFFESVAQLGVQAAEALEHAHTYGVVHRDIKPGNLLMDVRGHLWVTDFGLAQIQSDAAVTATGDLVGTLRYMSPEQALAKRGLVDHRTDIYSLGATLYELLTLEPVFDGRDREELLRQIAFEEPLPPRRLKKTIPVDLETIVLKAMAKGVEDRYATAQELADDLRRFLEHKPVRARRPTILERAGKWSRRHRSVAISAAVLLLLAAVGSATIAVLIAQQQQQTQTAYEAEAAQRKLADKHRDLADRHRELADQRFEQAHQMLNKFTQVFDEKLANKPDVQEVRRELLKAALGYYNEFLQQRGDDPTIRKELIRSHLRVASILEEMGSAADAQENYQQAGNLAEEGRKENPKDPEYGGQATFIQRKIAFGLARDPLRLLACRSVQKELGLTEDQAKKIGELQWRPMFPREPRGQFSQFSTNKRGAPYRGSHHSNPPWRPGLNEAGAATAKALEILNPQQRQRLKQIGWQLRGPLAFGDKEVAEVLHLTSEQKQRIEEIQLGATRQEHHCCHGEFRGEDWTKQEQSWRNIQEKLVNQLTTSQKAQWQQMLGKPFALPPSEMGSKLSHPPRRPGDRFGPGDRGGRPPDRFGRDRRGDGRRHH
jgi:serine/threonine protein kinase